MYLNLKLKITGHAVASDNRNKNIDLCIRRALKAANIIIRDNIITDRISFTVQGIDKSKYVLVFLKYFEQKGFFSFFC